jgi:hypothetical protein
MQTAAIQEHQVHVPTQLVLPKYCEHIHKTKRRPTRTVEVLCTPAARATNDFGCCMGMTLDFVLKMYQCIGADVVFYLERDPQRSAKLGTFWMFLSA